MWNSTSIVLLLVSSAAGTASVSAMSIGVVGTSVVGSAAQAVQTSERLHDSQLNEMAFGLPSVSAVKAALRSS